jgi:A/G-specific adenine glycosylase
MTLDLGISKNLALDRTIPNQKPLLVDLLTNWDAAKRHEFQRKLLGWYGKRHRALPWRENPTPYRVWVSEIMLQQTQVKTVIPYYNRFLERFPDIGSLAKASEQEVLELWSGLGYYSRARNLHKAARQIVEKYKEFPKDFDSILSLPGIGRYTAGAISSIAFNRPEPVVDGNVRRVITRLNSIRGHVREKIFWDLMSALIPKRRSSAFNQAMMELGALICVPFEPSCSLCPLKKLCEAKRLNIQNEIPGAAARQAIQRVQIVILVLERGGKILMTSGSEIRWIPGEWGLPCLRISDGESPEDAASMLCQSISGRAIPLTPHGRIHHSISNHRITAFGFSGNVSFSAHRPRATGSHRWIPIPRCAAMITSSLFSKALRKFSEMKLNVEQKSPETSSHKAR